jgi:branched-chain amino acid transport system permease protein
MNLDLFLQLTVNGILLGAFYATMALGFSIIWGVMRLINLAHGEFLLMAAYVAWFFYNPTREQDIIIGGGDPAEIQSTVQIIFAGAAVVLGFIVSEIILLERMQINWQRRIAGFGGVVLMLGLIYFVWQGEDFNALTMPMKTAILVGLALSGGFMMSHFVLKEVFFQIERRQQATQKYSEAESSESTAVGPAAWNNVWVRRLLGYGIAIIVVLIFDNRWAAGGYGAIDPFVALPLVLLIFFSMGYVLQNTLFNRLVEGPYLTMLLVTFAVKIILQNIGLQIYAADPRKINASYALDNWRIGDDLTISKIKFIILILSLVIAVGLIAFLNRTRIGYAIRAASQQKMAARLMGINIKETYAITFGIALAITAVAGALMGTFQPITPIGGDPWTLRAFAIVALGGLGRVQGVFWGGLVLGIVESYIGGYITTGWAVTAAFVILVVILLVRPQGIAGGAQLQEA